MHSSSCRAPLSLSALATPPRRSVCSSIRGRTLVAFHMTRSAPPGRRFKTPGSGFGSIWNFPNESVCQSYVGALRPDVPAACRQLARPESCPVSCVAPVQPPAPTGSVPPKPPEVTPPPEPDPKPDPASIETKPSDIQVGGKQYTSVAGLSWIERAHSFADVSVGPTELQSKDRPNWQPSKTAEKKRVVQGYDLAPQPMQGFIDVVMSPWDFLSYPGRRDW
jgi:hypothetical protein